MAGKGKKRDQSAAAKVVTRKVETAGHGALTYDETEAPYGAQLRESRRIVTRYAKGFDQDIDNIADALDAVLVVMIELATMDADGARAVELANDLHECIEGMNDTLSVLAVIDRAVTVLVNLHGIVGTRAAAKIAKGKK